MKIIKTMLASCLLLGSTAQAELDPYIGEIQFFGGNFAPRGWAFSEWHSTQKKELKQV